MDLDAFRIYCAKFENRVLIAGYERGLWRTELRRVPIRPGRLEKEPIGCLVGNRFVWDRIAVIDYYGHLKKSTAFMSQAVDLYKYQITYMHAVVLPFQAVRPQHIIDLAADLCPFWTEFQARVHEARWREEKRQQPTPTTG